VCSERWQTWKKKDSNKNTQPFLNETQSILKLLSIRLTTKDISSLLEASSIVNVVFVFLGFSQ
jgi:hypothetical protein